MPDYGVDDQVEEGLIWKLLSGSRRMTELHLGKCVKAMDLGRWGPPFDDAKTYMAIGDDERARQKVANRVINLEIAKTSNPETNLAKLVESIKWAKEREGESLKIRSRMRFLMSEEDS
jgi:hypothetical protein